MRCSFHPLGAALLLAASLASADYCDKGFKLNDGRFEFDLTPLKTDFIVSTVAETPPTSTKTEYAINPCAPVTWKAEKEEDKCKSGTYVCKRIINIKHDDERVTEVFQISGDYDGTLNPEFSFLDKVVADASQSGAQFSLILHGGKIGSQDQITNITFECDPQGQGTEPNPPSVISHENGVLALSWKTKHVCGKSLNPPPQVNGSSMSWIEYFFVSLSVITVLYFGLGAVYNRQMYNAKGWDLIPHRDFWQDLPGLIKDLAMHVYDSFSSRTRGGHGYVSV